jgi:S-methylmethionine-dependent homocysteine/selenocysteine methylase
MTVRLLDGAMGHEVHHRLGRPDMDWSALAARDLLDVVRALHEEYIAAGAEVIMTNTYPLGRWRVNTHGAAEHFASANEAACRAAQEARERAGSATLIAGAIGPVRASYQPDAIPPASVVEQEVVEQALVLAPHVDLFICETMSTAAEAAASARACLSTGRPVWVAFTVGEEERPVLRGGEPIGAAVRVVSELPVDAILLNCTVPEAVDGGIAELAETARVPVGAYANGFERIPDDVGFGTPVHKLATRDLSPDAYAAHAARWIEAGATIVGGCCAVGPAHIARLASLIRKLR